MNLQDVFLNQVRRENIPVTIYLVGGVQLRGMVRGFDSFTVILESPGKPPQMVYKHAIASVVPARGVSSIVAKEHDTGERAEPAVKTAAEPEPEPAKES